MELLVLYESLMGDLAVCLGTRHFVDQVFDRDVLVVLVHSDTSAVLNEIGFVVNDHGIGRVRTEQAQVLDNPSRCLVPLGAVLHCDHSGDGSGCQSREPLQAGHTERDPAIAVGRCGPNDNVVQASFGFEIGSGPEKFDGSGSDPAAAQVAIDEQVLGRRSSAQVHVYRKQEAAELVRAGRLVVVQYEAPLAVL